MKNIALKQVLIALLIGIFVGFGFGTWRRGMRDIRPMDADAHFKHMVKRFSSKLGLAAEQEKNVAVILQAKREKIEALRAEMKPRFEEIRQNAKDEIKKILNPEQQKKLDVLDEKMTKRWGRHSPM
jgi:hypothetical protein